VDFPAPVAHAIEISVAEVRGDVAFVKGSDAGRDFISLVKFSYCS
jgi:hypothetical protein